MTAVAEPGHISSTDRWVAFGAPLPCPTRVWQEATRVKPATDRERETVLDQHDAYVSAFERHVDACVAVDRFFNRTDAAPGAEIMALYLLERERYGRARRELEWFRSVLALAERAQLHGVRWQ